MKLETITDVKEYINDTINAQGPNIRADVVIDQLVREKCMEDNNFFYDHVCKMNNYLILYSNELRNTAKICQERGVWIKRYLDGEMYTDQDAPSKYDKIQSKNAEAIINATGAVLGRD